MNSNLKFPSCEFLNSEFAVEGSVSFDEGKEGFVFAKLAANGNTVEVSLHGGHVTSYKVGGQEILWLSPTAEYSAGKAIRGGIPICWPWFGPHLTDREKPSHGFARTNLWQVDTSFSHKEEAGIRLSLLPNASTRKIFEHDFELSLGVTLGRTLTLELCATNCSDSTLPIGGALHSYFRVDDISQVRLLGLEGVGYLDQLKDYQRSTQESAIEFSGEVDRVYLETDHHVTIENGSQIQIRKSGSLSTVVWNPWKAKSANIGDMPDDAYQTFVCVETANALDDVRKLKSGESHIMKQEIEKLQ